MDKQTGPNGFLVVLPSEIIEIPQDSDKSWLTLFYSLPRELAEKWKPANGLPRCPYEVLRTDKYDHIVCDDMFKLLVWDCYAWCAWQFFQVKDRKGNYRDIPGNWNQYAGYFPLWRLSYSIIPYIRMKFEQNGLGFQNLYNIPQGVEVPWLTYQQFSNLVGNVTDMVVAEQNWQPMIDAIWENRTVEDYETTSSTVKTDFMRKWHHNRSGKAISLDEMMENEDGDIFEVADPRGEFEQKVISEMQIAAFAEQSITEKDREILKLRMDGLTEQAVQKLKRAQQQKIQSEHTPPNQRKNESTLNVKLRLDATFFTDKRNRHNTISEAGHVRTLADLISLIYFYHTIAHTNMCLDVLWGLLCWLQLFPQCCHKYPQRSYIVIPTAAPDVLCDKGMGQYLANILGQQAQQLILNGRQVQFVLSQISASPSIIHFQFTINKYRTGGYHFRRHQGESALRHPKSSQ